MNLNEQLEFMLNTLINEIEKPIDVPIDFNSKKDLLRALMNIRPPRKISEEFLNIQNQFLQSQKMMIQIKLLILSQLNKKVIIRCFQKLKAFLQVLRREKVNYNLM